MTTEKKTDTQRYEELLHEIRESLVSPDEEKLERASLLLDEAARLNGDAGEIQRLREKLEQERQVLRARRAYDKAKAECEALWGQEQELLKNNVSPERILEAIYNEALRLAQAAYEQYPFFHELNRLVNDAIQQHDKARTRYQVKTTADRTHNYREALQTLQAEKGEKKGEGEDKEIPWYDERGQLVGSKTIREAIQILTADAREYARRKAEEYLQIARDHMENFQPRLARDILEKRQSLFLLPQEYDRKLAEYEDEVVKPALAKLTEAERLAAEAERSQDLSQGWDLLQDAMKAYPGAHAIEDARRSLMRRTLAAAQAYLDDAAKGYDAFCQGKRGRQGLDEAKTVLVQSKELRQKAQAAQGALQEAQRRFEQEIQDLQAQLEELQQKDKDNPLTKVLEENIKRRQDRLEAFLDSLKEENASLERLRQREDALGKKIEAALSYRQQIEKEYTALKNTFERNPDEAYTALQAFLTAYDDASYRALYGALERHLSGLNTLKARILAFRDFDAVLQEWEEAFLANDRAQIAQAVQEADDLLKNDDAIVASQREKARQLHLRLRGRLDFLRGVEAWERGDLAEAQEALRRVKALGEHPDAAEAKEILTAIEAQRKQEKEISRALSDARALLDEHPARAYETLKDLVDKPSVFRGEIVSTLARARRKWEEDLLIRLDEAMQSPDGMADELHRLAEALNALPEPRSLDTLRKARRARAVAFASDARIHERANRLSEALQAWNEARLLDPTEAEYEANWRRVRLEIVRRDLGRGPGEKETLGILQGLQDDLPNDSQVLALVAEQYYRLAHLGTLDTAEQLQYLERAGRAAEDALVNGGLSSAESGRLHDLLQKIERDNEVLRQQADIEQALNAQSTIAQLTEAIQKVEDLREKVAGDGPMTTQLERWWRALRDRLVRDLEAEDETLGQDERKFETRSKIALLSPDHYLAHEVGPTLIRKTERVLREIERLLDDYTGVQVTLSNAETRQGDPRRLVEAQQRQLEDLREQADMLYGLLKRFAPQAGPDAPRLKEKLIDKRGELVRWLNKVSDFRQAVNQLVYELSIAGEDDNWSQFDHICNQVIDDGFGKHRALLEILQRKDKVRGRRQRLRALYQEFLQALKNPRGEEILEAQEKLERLISKEDPKDEFGFQKDLVVHVPFQQQQVLRGLDEIKAWLDASVAQVKAFGAWVYQSGAKHIWPTKWSAHISERAQECADMKEVRAQIERLNRKGQFAEVELLLDLVVSGEQELDPDKLQRYQKGGFKKLIEKYARFLPLAEALEKLSQPPFDESALLPFLRDMLPAIDEFKQELQVQIDEAHAMRQRAQRRKSAWEGAQMELEQALENLRALEDGLQLPFGGKKTRLAEAKKRYEIAKRRCQEIAPEHPLLRELD